MLQLKKKHHKYILAFLILIPLLFLGGLLYVFDHLQNEERDYALNKEMFKLVKELDSYKENHGKYPATITDIRPTDNLCVAMMYPKCKKVYYKPINNNQDFRLAMHSFTWVILWYRKDACLDSEKTALPEAKSKEIITRFGGLWYFCAASPENMNQSAFPVYRKDKKIFDNPNEWPIL